MSVERSNAGNSAAAQEGFGMRYLFDDLDAVVARMSDAHLVLFLDFDGTLAPIVQTPEEAKLPAETRSIIESLAASARCSVAVVSGRSLEDIRGKVGVDGVVYIGNHGLEAAGAPTLPVYEPPEALRELLSWIRRELSARLASVHGVLFEDKKFSFAVHYRLVPPAAVASVEDAVRETIAALDVAGLLDIAAGKMVFELRPRLGWNKGTAVAWLLHTEERLHPEGVFPIYIGDDVTDENGFRALAGKGISVLVGEQRGSSASHHVRNTEEVTRLLRSLAERCGAPHGR
jgi:trehalose 6-phosphate phosphatase